MGCGTRAKFMGAYGLGFRCCGTRAKFMGANGLWSACAGNVEDFPAVMVWLMGQVCDLGFCGLFGLRTVNIQELV